LYRFHVLSPAYNIPLFGFFWKVKIQNPPIVPVFALTLSDISGKISPETKNEPKNRLDRQKSPESIYLSIYLLCKFAPKPCQPTESLYSPNTQKMPQLCPHMDSGFSINIVIRSV
jgi:hypothetical protein